MKPLVYKLPRSLIPTLFTSIVPNNNPMSNEELDRIQKKSSELLEILFGTIYPNLNTTKKGFFQRHIKRNDSYRNNKTGHIGYFIITISSGFSVGLYSFETKT